MTRLVLGTRGSELARAQTALVEKALRTRSPETELSVRIIKTRGDDGGPLSAQGRKGLFTGEIERALLEREIDVAVHSAKDLPSEINEQLEIAAVLPRAPVEDVLVTKTVHGLDSVPKGCVIGTGSVRRQFQLRWRRPDLEVFALRGNVPTRLRKLDENPWEGIVLARAGIQRLGYRAWSRGIRFGTREFHVEVLDRELFLPAGGQGVIAIQIRRADHGTRSLVGQIDQPDTFSCLQAEREFLRLLQGDCNTPVGVFALIAGDIMSMRAQVFDEDRIEPRRAVMEGPKSDGCALAARLLEAIDGR